MRQKIEELQKLSNSDNLEVKNTALLGLDIINQMSNDNLDKYTKLMDDLIFELKSFSSGYSDNFDKVARIFNDTEIIYEILKEEKPFLSDIKQFPETAIMFYSIAILVNNKKELPTLPYEEKLKYYKSIIN